MILQVGSPKPAPELGKMATPDGPLNPQILYLTFGYSRGQKVGTSVASCP